MTAKVAESRTLPSTFGVGIFYDFMEECDYGWNVRRIIKEHAPPRGGCGWNIAGFIKTDESKEVYEDLQKKYKMVTQSPVRRNNNSGNSFFYVMYDCKKPRKSKKNPEGKWDLSGNLQYKWPWK